ncbi:hypothetical protein KP509_09G004500 [Ceratopteris richardii]|uniref:Uncharacterized protein n=1 Tax=Ceratopteris richardii TaxID=49495 RepID=A0A8T2TYD7_CERRI|nr:hypothetical protein KP509_09G004500 [Ceratopteris richardii]
MTVCSQIVATVSFCGRKSGFDAGFSESTRALPFNANACKLKAGCARARPTVCRSRLLLLCVKCDGSVESESSVELVDDQHQIGGGNNSGKGNNGRFSGGGDGDGGGDDEDDGDHSHSELDKEYGRLLKSDEINAQLRAEGLTLPPDMAEAAKALGLRSLVLDRFIRLQGAAWPLGSAIRGSTMLRNRMLADQSFLFKLLTEIAIDSGCATIAEVKQRGDDFWNEFELFMADLVVGVVVDAALVSMLAPYIQFRRPATAAGVAGALSRTLQSLPSSVFEAATPGRTYSIQQRVASYFYKGLQYGAVGFGCGVIGQGIANMIMLLKRKLKKSDTDVPVPPLFKSALLWGVFLGVSSNTRYQIVNGLERVVEGASLSKRLPVIAMAFTICIRFANNIYGGMQFVDWARLSGVQ